MAEKPVYSLPQQQSFSCCDVIGLLNNKILPKKCPRTVLLQIHYYWFSSLFISRSFVVNLKLFGPIIQRCCCLLVFPPHPFALKCVLWHFEALGFWMAVEAQDLRGGGLQVSGGCPLEPRGFAISHQASGLPG